MREIKFRMWDIAKNNWSIEANIYTSDGGMIIGGVADNGLVFQEFTGLKDKNGKEIYEGDIVKWFADCVDKFAIIEYGWNGGFVAKRISNNADLRINYDFQSFIPVTIMGFEGEVIGNIYENPNLIELISAPDDSSDILEETNTYQTLNETEGEDE